MILQVVDASGVSYTNTARIGKAFTQLYKNLFTSTNPSQFDACLHALCPKVSSDMNVVLLQPCNEEEVATVVFQMGTYKAPGPVGYGACFYQAH